ncbi:hypothetical protein D3C84_1013510 [compost metagenome]
MNNVVIDVFVDIKPRTCGARLAAIQHYCLSNARDRGLQVSVRKYDYRALATELKRHSLEARCRRSRNCFPSGGTSSE